MSDKLGVCMMQLCTCTAFGWLLPLRPSCIISLIVPVQAMCLAKDDRLDEYREVDVPIDRWLANPHASS